MGFNSGFKGLIHLLYSTVGHVQEVVSAIFQRYQISFCPAAA